MGRIHAPPLRWWERMCDGFMWPFMVLVSGTVHEAPQRTHRWNNRKLTTGDVMHLDASMMVYSHKASCRRPWLWKLPLFHLPICGGWKKYVVLEPVERHRKFWRVGWVSNEVCGVSRVLIYGPVRVLAGNEDALHFGVDRNGKQIPIRKIGEGTIGKGGSFAHLPLL